MIPAPGHLLLIDPILFAPALIVIACAALLLLSSKSKRRRRAAPASPRPTIAEAPQLAAPQEASPEAADIVEPVATAAPLAPVPKEQTAGWWWTRLLSGRAVIGLVLLPLQPLVVLINSYVLSIRMEVLIGGAGEPLFELEVAGWAREVTVYDLIGALISVSAVILAAAFVNAAGRAERSRWTALLAFVALLCTITLEVALSVVSAHTGGADGPVAALSGLLALCVALTDVAVGIYTLEHFISPLTLALAWTVAAPFRAVARRVRERAIERAAAEKRAKRAHAHEARTPSAAAGRTRGRSVSESIVAAFRPLDDLTALTYRRLRRLKKLPRKQGEEAAVCTTN